MATVDKCGATWRGPWTGDLYVCGLKGPHLYHKGHCGGDAMEWPNYEGFCANPFPNTNDLCKRPPNHKGFCRVKVFGQVKKFKPMKVKQ